MILSHNYYGYNGKNLPAMLKNRLFFYRTMQMTAEYTWIDVIAKGTPPVIFRFSQPLIHIANSILLSKSASPAALAADGIASTMKSFLIHTPGSFIHLIGFHFKIENFHENSNLFYAAMITVAGLSVLELPILIFSGTILRDIFKLDPILSQNVQDCLRAFCPGLIITELFSVNRQFLNSECIKTKSFYPYLLPLIGFGGLGIFIASGYWLIPQYGNRGSGYTYTISITFEYLASLALLFSKKEFRQHLLQRPDIKLILPNIRRMLDIHAPVCIRFLAESINGVAFSLIVAAHQNSLTALHICNTTLQLVDLPCFSFFTSAKVLITSSIHVAKTSFMVTFIPTAYSILWEIPFSIPTVSNWICDFFLSSQSPENREAIKTLVTTLLPIMGAGGVVSCLLHGQRALLQAGAQRVDNRKNLKQKLINPERHDTFNTLKKENWFITGNTLAFQALPFLSLCWFIGKYFGFGVKGIAILNLLCMVALMTGLAPRTVNFLRNPNNSPQSCWAHFWQRENNYAPVHTRSFTDTNQTIVQARIIFD